jgi:hypothetical protein
METHYLVRMKTKSTNITNIVRPTLILEKLDADRTERRPDLDLRKRANQAGDSMGQCFEESKRAYSSGDGARAKQLSEEGKRHKAEMERLNREASDWIYHG